MRRAFTLLAAVWLCACSSTTSLGDPGPGKPDQDTGSADPVLYVPPALPAYPAGPYGKTRGAVIPNLSWEGYRNGTGDWTTITLGDYYDPDGSRGVTAIKVNLTAQW